MTQSSLNKREIAKRSVYSLTYLPGKVSALCDVSFYAPDCCFGFFFFGYGNSHYELSRHRRQHRLHERANEIFPDVTHITCHPAGFKVDLRRRRIGKNEK